MTSKATCTALTVRYLVPHLDALLVERRVAVVELKAVADHQVKVRLEVLHAPVLVVLHLRAHRRQIHRLLDDAVVLGYLSVRHK